MVKEGKTGDRGINMIFVGYPMNRKEDSYQVWNNDMNGAVTSQDMIFIKRVFFAPAIKTETVELGDLPAVKNKAEDAVEEEKEDIGDNTT